MTQTPNTDPASGETPGQGGDSGGSLALAMAVAGPVARLVMAGVFVIAGLTKVWDPVLFYWEALSYAELMGLERDLWPALGRLAVGMGPIETAVGLALLVNWRPRLVLPLAIAFMVAFLGLTGMAWYGGSDMDCGCFGALVERTPAQAFVEDVVMLGLLCLAWWRGRTRWPAAPAPALIRGALAGLILCLCTTALRFYPESHRLESSDLKPGVRLAGLDLKGPDLSLEHGEFLAELFSPLCGRCRRAVPKLNYWVDTEGLPPVVGITMAAQDDPDLAHFKKQFRPRYLIATVSMSDWRRLTWRHGYPRLAYVRDGVIQRVWEYNATPTTRQLRAVIENSRKRAAGHSQLTATQQEGE